MLTGEQAREQMKQAVVQDWEQKHIRAFMKLPEVLQGAAFDLMNITKEGKAGDWNDREKRQLRAVVTLEQSTPAEREQFFAAFLPKLAPYVEAGWQLIPRLPYQIHGQRRAFRAPHSEADYRTIRALYLNALWQHLTPYDEDVRWVAAYGGYFPVWHTDAGIGILLGAAIEQGGAVGNEVYDILIASARGEHPIGIFGAHVIRAFMVASRQEGWTYIEKMLLAAQREEGLRQSILERADEAHPDVFRRFLRLILEQDLTRFSATVRAVDVWFGFLHDATQPAAIRRLLTQMVAFLDDAQARDEALATGDPATLYLALCAVAFEDAYSALEVVRPLTTHPDPERRMVAYHFLHQLHLNATQSLFRQGLADEDLRVARLALTGVVRQQAQEPELFTALESLFARLPAKAKTFDPVIWEWFTITVDRTEVATALYYALGALSPKRLIPYLEEMGTNHYGEVLKQLAKLTPWDAETRSTLLGTLSHRSAWVRNTALSIIADARLAPDEVEMVEGLLTRKAAELRQGVIQLLLNQTDEQAQASLTRLLAHKQEPVRLAGLELARQLLAAERVETEVQRLVEGYRTQHATVSNAESTLLNNFSTENPIAATLDDALGLCDHSQRTPPTPPNVKRKWFGMVKEKPPLQSEAATKLMTMLDNVVAIHATTPLDLKDYYGEQEHLLGNTNQNFFPIPHWNITVEKDVERLPLRTIWETWWQNRPADVRDTDGLELIRAYAAMWGHYYFRHPGNGYPEWQQALRKSLFVPIPPLKYERIVFAVVQWLIRLNPPQNAPDLFLDGVEYTLAHIPKEVLQEPVIKGLHQNSDKRSATRIMSWLEMAYFWHRQFPQAWSQAQLRRLWGLARYLDEPIPNSARYRPPFELMLTLYGNGDITDADVYDHLLGSRGATEAFSTIRNVTTRKYLKEVETSHPKWHSIIERTRARIVEVEQQRGDLPTAATAPALALSSVEGAETVLGLLKSLGNASLTRQWRSDNSKAGTFSHLLRVSLPAPDDTPDAFAARAKAEKIATARLMELALAAPQWANYVETALQWDGFAEAVWWILAHTKDNHWSVAKEIKEMWTAQVAERTPLTATELVEGAVDVAWFQRVYATLGAERWKKIYDAAKYASSGTGHARAKLFADAMLGRVTTAELSQRALVKRHQDSIRALGLIPLPEGEPRFTEVLTRYKTVQEFRRGNRKFGSQRQANEKLAAGIALDNLARTAGYADPIRLQWAMEAYDAADLSDGPLTVTVGEVAVSLAVNDFGEAELSVTKNGKPLKNVPPAVKKEPAVAALLKRKTEVKQQLSRMRLSLEQAMVRGDIFTGAELAELGKHPLLAALLEELLFIGEGIIGYPTDNGRGLLDTQGKVHPLGSQEQLRLAHPYDLYQRGDWHEWQRDCFLAERSQPFKQVFRELYLLTQSEMGEGHISRRYAGHQVQPRQTVALLGGRGWIAHPYDGIFKTFHAENLTVWLSAMGLTYSPADMEGLTLEGVMFSQKGSYLALPLTEIPSRLFSEVMRDLDLVVSVAHAGGVDPEASASTVEIRAALIRETTDLLGIENVTLTNAHALIKGHLNQYSVHLGSAVVHRQPGGSVCIVPVHSQHRGRLFLPFADDDPKSAEVLSKVLLLARDKEIKDPTILQQLL
jgi:hypothetical protein